MRDYQVEYFSIFGKGSRVIAMLTPVGDRKCDQEKNFLLAQLMITGA
jgi:hypothetical protein